MTCEICKVDKGQHLTGCSNTPKLGKFKVGDVVTTLYSDGEYGLITASMLTNGVIEHAIEFTGWAYWETEENILKIR